MSAPSIVILVPHPNRPAVLTTADGALPTTAGCPAGSSTADHLAAVTERLGALPPVLRIVLGQLNGNGESERLLVDLETIGLVAPDGLTWTDAEDLDLSAAPPDLHDGPRDDPACRVGGWIHVSQVQRARLRA